MINLFKRYSFFDVAALAMYKIITPFYFSKARLIRLPIQIRGKHLMQVGKNFTTGKYCRIEALENEDKSANKKMLSIGNDVQINDNVHIAVACSVSIGNNVLIASKVFISDHNHGNYNIGTEAQDSPLTIPIKRPLMTKPVVIKDNVWLGEFVSVLPGVTIGEGSIIGTMSVVNRDIPPFCIAVGSPAKVVKEYNFESQTWEKR
jgi:lipopolysaccharide O-acetyltransferase